MILWRGFGILYFIALIALPVLWLSNKTLADFGGKDQLIKELLRSWAISSLILFLPAWFIGRKLNKPYGPIPGRYKKKLKAFLTLFFENDLLMSRERPFEKNLYHSQHSLFFIRMEAFALLFAMIGLIYLILNYFKIL